MKSLQKLTRPKLMQQQLLALTLLLLTTLWGGQALAQNVDVVEARGEIQEVNAESNRLVINGVEYRVAYDAQVRIRGGYGSFSMLQSGMKAFFEYNRYGPDELEIFNIEQLPDNTVLEES